MKALILNSGLGHRMGDITESHPKCMTNISGEETILSRQLRLLSASGISEVVITTGYLADTLMDYVHQLDVSLGVKFVNNLRYKTTNYIYSIHCAKEELHDDILLLHGDIVFDVSVLKDLLAEKESAMVVSSTQPLPAKDFKAVIRDGKISKVGVPFFESALAAQAMYKLKKKDWDIWLSEIEKFCENGDDNVYAEQAFNQVSNRCIVYPLDVKNRLCMEIDTPEDLAKAKELLKNE